MKALSSLFNKICPCWRSTSLHFAWWNNPLQKLYQPFEGFTVCIHLFHKLYQTAQAFPCMQNTNSTFRSSTSVHQPWRDRYSTCKISDSLHDKTSVTTVCVLQSLVKIDRVSVSATCNSQWVMKASRGLASAACILQNVMITGTNSASADTIQWNLMKLQQVLIAFWIRFLGFRKYIFWIAKALEGW